MKLISGQKAKANEIDLSSQVKAEIDGAVLDGVLCYDGEYFYIVTESGNSMNITMIDEAQEVEIT